MRTNAIKIIVFYGWIIFCWKFSFCFESESTRLFPDLHFTGRKDIDIKLDGMEQTNKNVFCGAKNVSIFTTASRFFKKLLKRFLKRDSAGKAARKNWIKFIRMFLERKKILEAWRSLASGAIVFIKCFELNDLGDFGPSWSQITSYAVDASSLADTVVGHSISNICFFDSNVDTVSSSCKVLLRSGVRGYSTTKTISLEALTII